MDSSVLVGVITSVATVLGMGIGLAFGRKKNEAETKRIDTESETGRILNFKNTIDIYNIVHKELSAELKNVMTRCVDLTSEMVIFREENYVLKNEIAALRKENVLLKDEMHVLNARLKASEVNSKK